MPTSNDSGKCGSHTYQGYTPEHVAKLLEELKKSGMSVQQVSEFCWDVDTHQYDVKLRGTVTPTTNVLSVIITDKVWYAPCAEVWKKIDPILQYASTFRLRAECVLGDEAVASSYPNFYIHNFDSPQIYRMPTVAGVTGWQLASLSSDCVKVLGYHGYCGFYTDFMIIWEHDGDALATFNGYAAPGVPPSHQYVLQIYATSGYMSPQRIA